MIENITLMGYDSLIASKEIGFLWHEQNDGSYSRIDSGDVPRTLKKNHLLDCMVWLVSHILILLERVPY